MRRGWGLKCGRQRQAGAFSVLCQYSGTTEGYYGYDGGEMAGGGTSMTDPSGSDRYDEERDAGSDVDGAGSGERSAGWKIDSEAVSETSGQQAGRMDEKRESNQEQERGYREDSGGVEVEVGVADWGDAFGEVGEKDETFFEVLATRGGREVLDALTVAPRSVSEIVGACEVSQATVYRQLDRLAAAGIVAERERIREEGGRQKLVRLVLSEVVVTFRQALQVAYVPTKPESRLEWLLRALSDATHSSHEQRDASVGDD